MSDSTEIVIGANTAGLVEAMGKAEKATDSASLSVDGLKKRIAENANQQVESAQKQGASVQELERIYTQAAQRRARVTDATLVSESDKLDRFMEKNRRYAAELQSLRAMYALPAGPSASHETSLKDVPNRLKTSTVLRVAEGTTSIRGAEAFISSVPMLAKLSNLVFPVASALGFAAIIGEGVSKLKEMYETAEKLPSAIAEGFAAISRPIMANVDALRQDNDQLQATINKLEHKPSDNLALALDDARKRTDALADSARTASDAVQKLLHDNQVSEIGKLFLGQGDSSAVSKEIKSRFAGITSSQNVDKKQSGYEDYRARQITNPKKRDAAERKVQTDQDHRQAAINKQLSDLQDYIRNQRKMRNGDVLDANGKPMMSSGVEGSANGGLGVVVARHKITYADLHGDQKANNNALNGAEDIADAMQMQRSLSARNVTLTGKAKGLQGDKDLADEQTKVDAKWIKGLQLTADKLESNGATAKAIYDFWKRNQAAYADGSARFDLIVEKTTPLSKAGATRFHRAVELIKSGDVVAANDFLTGHKEKKPDEGQDLISSGNTMLANWNKANARKADEAAKMRTRGWYESARAAAAYKQVLVEIDQRTGRISNSEAATKTANIHAQEYAQQMTTLKAEVSRQHSLDPNSAASVGAENALGKAQADRQVQIQQDAANSAAAAWKGALTNAYDEWYQYARDTAGQVADLFNKSLDGANQNLTNLMTGDYKRGDIKRFGHSIFKTASSDLLQHSEASLLGVIGKKSKADGSATNPYYVRNADGTPGAGASSLIAAASGHGGANGKGGGSGILGSLANLFHPHASPNAPGYDKGSMGLGVTTAKPGWFSQVANYVEQAMGIAVSAKGSFGGGASPGDSLSWDATSGGEMYPSGGYALGGGVSQSGVYDVGEMGREKVFLPKGSYVQPNDKLGGGNVYYSVQVANGVTPEETDMRVRAALQEYHPHAMKAAVAAVHDDNRSRPRSR